MWSHWYTAIIGFGIFAILLNTIQWKTAVNHFHEWWAGYLIILSVIISIAIMLLAECSNNDIYNERNRQCIEWTNVETSSGETVTTTTTCTKWTR